MKLPTLQASELDLDHIGTWPIFARAIVIGLVAIAIFVVGYLVDISAQIKTLDTAVAREESLKKEFEEKYKKSANLAAYKEQMVTMKESFGALLGQLPESNEVPGLVEDISHQGLATGLEFRTIRLLPERQMDFYRELPIQIVVLGTYHQLAEFVSNVAGLPRIVTLHDFGIKPLNAEQRTDFLTMEITAKTYRYSEGDIPIPVTEKDKKANKKTGKQS